MTADERRALAAGLPPDLLLRLITARRLWHADNDDTPAPEVLTEAPFTLGFELPRWWWIDDDLAEAVRHPAASTYDGIFVAAMLRRLRS